MTFPTEQDRLFFTSEEAKRIQQEWKNRGPRIGDFFIRPGTDKWEIVDEELLVILSFGIEAFWLPRQGQLQEMLEEKGYGLYHLGDERFHPDFDGKDWNPEEPYRALAQGKEPGDYVKGTGPTPAIALGRALIEVVGKEALTLPDNHPGNIEAYF